MAVHDFRSQRLYVDTSLKAAERLHAEREQANYLLNVLRLKSDDKILVFNGIDGEWQARIEATGRKKCSLVIEQQTRSQPEPYRLEYCFAPLKQARLDYMIQKAVEMGAGRLIPVLTQYTQVRSINSKRMHANSVEAAEQCGILNLPEICEPIHFVKMLEDLAPDTLLVFCDEEASNTDELSRLSRSDHRAIRLLIGPEGGFSSEERNALNRLPNVVRLGLGPRILRADTAAVAGLAVVQSKMGDWYDDK